MKTDFVHTVLGKTRRKCCFYNKNTDLGHFGWVERFQKVDQPKFTRSTVCKFAVTYLSKFAYIYSGVVVIVVAFLGCCGKFSVHISFECNAIFFRCRQGMARATLLCKSDECVCPGVGRK